MASKLNSRIWGSCGLHSYSPGLDGLCADLPLFLTLDSPLALRSPAICVWVTQSFSCPPPSGVSSHVQAHRITGKKPSELRRLTVEWERDGNKLTSRIANESRFRKHWDLFQSLCWGWLQRWRFFLCSFIFFKAFCQANLVGNEYVVPYYSK